MKIANEFTVSVPIERAWEVLTDMEQVIPLMPGAQLVGHEGDDFLGGASRSRSDRSRASSAARRTSWSATRPRTAR